MKQVLYMEGKVQTFICFFMVKRFSISYYFFLPMFSTEAFFIDILLVVHNFSKVFSHADSIVTLVCVIFISA